MAASNAQPQRQGTEPAVEVSHAVMDAGQAHGDHGFDGPEVFSNDYDDGRGGDDGDDYMQHETDLEHEGIAGQLF